MQAPSLELSDPALLRQDAFVGGQWLASDERYPIINPASGAELAAVTRVTAADVARGIDAATRALGEWQALTALQRSNILRRMAELMAQHERDLALILTSEQGKPLAEAVGELRYAAGFFDWFSGEARRVYGTTIPAHRSDVRVVVTREAVGVCAGITPWNFPSAMITRKLAAALAAGCVMLVKPAEATPLSALALAVLSERAGLPAGAFSVLTGSRQDAEMIGNTLLEDTRVRKLSFTGSTAVGKQLAAKCAENVQRVSLELGGNAPFIVFDDADLDAAVSGAVACKFRNCGQTCVTANRLLVHRSVLAEFSTRLKAKVSQLTLGPGTEPNSKLGPLINQAAVDKVEAHIQDALAGGAKLLLGGQRSALGGTYFEPTILTDVSSEMLVCREETFGPVAPLIAFETEAEAIALANDTNAGLAAYFYTRDLARSTRMAEALQYGMLGINTGLISTEVAPFGGVKHSGVGREGSRFGMDDYLEHKYLCYGAIHSS